MPFVLTIAIILLGGNSLQASQPADDALVLRDTTPNPWQQWEYIEVVEENEEFDRPFGQSGVSTKVIKQRKRPILSSYDTEKGTVNMEKANIPKIIPVEPVASSDQLPPVAEVREDYSGFKIELMTTDTELQPDHELFFKHGNVQLQRKGTGTFSYLMGAYSSEWEAQRFYDEYLADQYPEGKVVEFQKGQRIE